MLRGIHIAQVTHVHPPTLEVSVVFPDLNHAEGARVRVASPRQHPTAGVFQLPEPGDWGVVAFWTDSIAAGIWLGSSVSDLHRHLIPSEILEADPHAKLEHLPSDRYALHHGDGTEEHVWPDGSFLKLTTRKDDTPGNSTERAKLTDRYRTLSSEYGQEGERQAYAPKERPPVDVLFTHSSGATVSITADGSFNLTTPKGHAVKLHDGTEKARSSDDGSVTSTPEEDANRVTSELVLTTEQGHEVILHDDPVLLVDRHITIRHAIGHEVVMKDDPNVNADRHVTIKTASGHQMVMRDLPADDMHVKVSTLAGHEFTMRDTPGADMHATLSTAGGHTLELRDTPTVVATVSTPGGRSVTLDDDGTVTTIADPVKVVIDAPLVEVAGGGPAVARVGDTVSVTVTGGSSAGTYTGTITSGSSKTSSG